MGRSRRSCDDQPNLHRMVGSGGVG